MEDDNRYGSYCNCTPGGGAYYTHRYMAAICERPRPWGLNIPKCITLRYYGFDPLPLTILPLLSVTENDDEV